MKIITIFFLVSILMCIECTIKLKGTLNSTTLQKLIENKENLVKIFEEVKTLRLLIQTNSIRQQFFNIPGKTFEVFNINYKSIEYGVSCHTESIKKKNSFQDEIFYYDIDDHANLTRHKRELIKIKQDKNDFFNVRKLWSKVEVEGGFVLETNGKLFDRMLDCLINPLGIFLFVFRTTTKVNNVMFPDTKTNNDTNGTVPFITQLDILQSLRNAWTNTGSVKIFIYFQDQLFEFNPFVYNDLTKTYGILKNFHVVTYRKENFYNLHGYPLRLDIFPSAFSLPIYDPKTKQILYYKGADAEVVKVIMKKMNFSTIVAKPHPDSFGYKLPNGSFTGVISRIIDHESDLAITGFFLKDYMTKDLEFTVVMGSDELCCVVQKAKKIPPFILPLSCFEPILWLFIFLTMVTTASCWTVLRRLNEIEIFTWYYRKFQLSKFAVAEDRFNRSQRSIRNPNYQFIQIIVDTVILTMSAPLRRFSKVASERYLMASLCLISMIFVSIFQSTLATVFIKPSYYKDITTLKDLDDSHLKIGLKYQAIIDDIFPLNTTSVIESLKKKLYLVENKKLSMMALIAAHGRVATATRKTTLSLDNAIFITNQSLFMVPECPRTYGLAYVLPRHSVLMERVNSILLHLLNGGIIEKWIGDMYYNQTWIDIKRYGRPYTPNFKVLEVDDFELSYFILSFGCSLSAVIFIGEILVLRFKRRKRSKILKRNGNNNKL